MERYKSKPNSPFLKGESIQFLQLKVTFINLILTPLRAPYESLLLTEPCWALSLNSYSLLYDKIRHHLLA